MSNHKEELRFCKRLTEALERDMREYQPRLVLETSLADVFCAGYKAGFLEGRKEAYQAIAKAFDSIEATKT